MGSCGACKGSWRRGPQESLGEGQLGSAGNSRVVAEHVRTVESGGSYGVLWGLQGPMKIVGGLWKTAGVLHAGVPAGTVGVCWGSEGRRVLRGPDPAPPRQGPGRTSVPALGPALREGEESGVSHEIAARKGEAAGRAGLGSKA